MNSPLALFPKQASTIAPQVDFLYFFLVGVSVFFTVLIFILIIFFMVRYRRRETRTERPDPHHTNIKLEILWSVIPLFLVMIMFGWGAKLYFTQFKPPADAMEIFVVGKQWMWKIQHPEGKREINELHVPKGQPVKLTITSQDVIHSFYVPAFRIKMDAVPGKYTSAWFEATETGEYHLFCAEYCGTEHSLMRGRVIVMEPEAYETWLEEDTGESREETMAMIGRRLFDQKRCITCHLADDETRGPDLRGLFGSTVQIQGGGSVVADESYIRESILKPNEKMVSGYPPLMPTYKGQITEEEILAIISYIKSMSETV